MKTLLLLILVASISISGCSQKNDETGGLINMKISSPLFENGEEIPDDYTCDGDDISPELVIEGIPKNAKSLALIMDDPDAPAGTWVHWIVWNIAPDTKVIEEDNATGTEGMNSFGDQGYGGPCPPSGTHRYFFKLYALDTLLQLNESSTAKDLEKAMKGHIMEKAELMGTYSRQ